MGKGDRRKKPRQRLQARDFSRAEPHYVESIGDSIRTADLAVRPTPERYRRGDWRFPKGIGKHEMPAVDLAADIVGVMYENRLITSPQEQAARTVQSVYGQYIAEFCLAQGRSCLDMSPVGHDTGEGDPEAMAAWRDISAKLSYLQEGALMWTVIQGNLPASVELVRSALDAVIGGRKDFGVYPFGIRKCAAGWPP